MEVSVGGPGPEPPELKKQRSGLQNSFGMINNDVSGAQTGSRAVKSEVSYLKNGSRAVNSDVSGSAGSPSPEHSERPEWLLDPSKLHARTSLTSRMAPRYRNTLHKFTYRYKYAYKYLRPIVTLELCKLHKSPQFCGLLASAQKTVDLISARQLAEHAKESEFSS